MSEQIDDQITSWTYDSLNRLVTQTPGGLLKIRGQLNEAGTVTVNGQPTLVSAANLFEGHAQVGAGTTGFTIVAANLSGNTTTQPYEVDTAGAAKVFTFDANGNMTSDGARTFEWDVRNQLVAVNVGTHRSEFTYDGSKRRVRVVERESGAIQTETRVVWCGTDVCEERSADGTTATRRSFQLGEQAAGGQRYFATDHLRSVTEVTGSAATLLARYAFDPWGRRTQTTGSDLTVVGFTGHRWQASAGLWLTLYRGYDADAGRWLNPDPIGMAGGINLYAYAADAPVRFVDPLGLKVSCSSSLDYQYGVKQTRCGSAGCTWASMSAPAATPCKQECGEWKFDGSVKLDILVQYAVDPKLPSSDTPGATLAEHEALHVADWQQWCGGLGSKYPSEGFTSKSACDRARNNFLRGVGKDFLANLESTRGHDGK